VSCSVLQCLVVCCSVCCSVLEFRKVSPVVILYGQKGFELTFGEFPALIMRDFLWRIGPSKHRQNDVCRKIRQRRTFFRWTITDRHFARYRMRNTLQHAATRCNTLQCTAMHCNTLKRAVTHCNALQGTATHCNTLQHIVGANNDLLHNTSCTKNSPKSDL